MRTFWQKLISRLQRINWFNLGLIFVAWYGVAFFLVPLAAWFGLPTTYVSAITGGYLPLYNFRYFLVTGGGLLSFIFGFFVLRRLLKGRATPLMTFALDLTELQLVFVFTAMLNLAVKAFKLLSGYYFHLIKNPAVTNSPYAALIGIADWLGVLGLGIGFGIYYTLKKQGSPRFRFWQRLMYSFLALELLYNFFSLGKLELLIPLTMFLAVRYLLYRRELRWVVMWVIIFQFFLAPLQSALSTPKIFAGYVRLWERRAERASLANTTGQSSSGVKVFSGRYLATLDFVADGVFARFDQSRSLGKILLYTDRLLYGQSLKSFFISLGPPRFIWTAKPVVNDGHNEFGRTYSILAPNDYETTVTPGIVGDLYMNFGIAGVWLGLFSFGGLLALLISWLLALPLSVYSVAVYGVLVLMISHAFEGWIGPSFAEIVKQSVMMMVLGMAGQLAGQRFRLTWSQLFKRK